MVEMLCSSIALTKAQQLSLRYANVLGISKRERFRYHAKALNLAWCYAGFRTRFSLEQAMGAGRAGFLSAAYDVITDWRDPEDDKDWGQIFKAIALQEAKKEQVEVAIGLMERDLSNNLKEDGLERGSISLNLILDMMGIKKEIGRKVDIDELGLLLQIVDDALDYEQDLETKDTNCFTTERADFYLRRLESDLTDERIETLFPRGYFLRKMVIKAREKASSIII